MNDSEPEITEVGPPASCRRVSMLPRRQDAGDPTPEPEITPATLLNLPALARNEERNALRIAPTPPAATCSPGQLLYGDAPRARHGYVNCGPPRRWDLHSLLNPPPACPTTPGGAEMLGR